jgi:starch synthase
MRVLFATSEIQPLIRTGGLAEVSWGLPRALRDLGHDVRVVLPNYPQVTASTQGLAEVARLELFGASNAVRILSGHVVGSELPLYLVDSPPHFDREGGPYANADGDAWADNAERFALFCRAIVAMASSSSAGAWRPDLIHCNDWQTGLVPALLSHEPRPPAVVFTIHNLGLQGLFSWEVFHKLQLPRTLWTRHGVEHYGNFSFIKGGLAFSERITTVSPTHAREIQTEIHGGGLEEVVRRHSERLTGILNGIDLATWDPQRDPYLRFNFDTERLTQKSRNKLALQRRFDLSEDVATPMLIHVGQLNARRGCDLVLEALPRLLELGVQIMVIGRGERVLEDSWKRAASDLRGQVATVIGDDDALLHLAKGGADILLMPSRVEPCGLQQLHCLRYATIPVVHRTGGLADTVRDAGDRHSPATNATGFSYEGEKVEDLLSAVQCALSIHRNAPEHWLTLMRNAMACDFGWPRSAARYEVLYREALQYNAELRGE